MGKKKTTGRYETREELERMVFQWYDNTHATMKEIAATMRVSEPTVRKILNGPRPNNTPEENRATRP